MDETIELTPEEAKRKKYLAELGKKGEGIAVKYLIEKGYKILSRNYIFKKAEIDIIATIGNEIIFVEVKTRTSSYLTDPSLLVPMKKQKQIIKASDNYVKEFHPEKEWRYDIMIVITNKEYTSVEHIEDAYYPMV
jgi:putative endonuclease